MNPTAPQPKRRRIIAPAVLVAVIVAGAALWKIANQNRPARGQASDALVSDFFTSLAALDVEENQRAVEILSEAVRAEPGEPALWANLTVAHLRLRDMDSAMATLDKATALAGDAPEVALIRAEALKQRGEIEPAIEALRHVHDDRPQDLATTYSLVTLLGQIGSSEADDERLGLLTEILTRSPENLRARCQQARLAATLEQLDVLQPSLNKLAADDSGWPDAARTPLERAQTAVAEQRLRDAATALTIFENLVKPLPAYQRGVAELGAAETTVGTPLRRFLNLTLPSVQAAEADLAMTFAVTAISEDTARPDLVLTLPQVGERRSTLMSLSESMLQVGEPAALSFPGSSTGAFISSVLSADVNADFRPDLILAGPSGCRIFLQQEDGSFLSQDLPAPAFSQRCRSVWSADLDADGDLDLLLSDHESALRCMRNNGDMTFTAVDLFAGVTSVTQYVSADLDNDGDVDGAALDASGRVVVWLNQRSGQYADAELPASHAVLTLAIGDVQRDGQFDLVTLGENGDIEQHTLTAETEWTSKLLATWPRAANVSEEPETQFQLQVADLDNNGAVDILATTAFAAAIWLGGIEGGFSPLADAPPLFVTSIIDIDDDGLLDLVGLTEDAGAVAANQSSAGHQWLVVEPRAIAGAGDQRINTFGIGGRIEVRAGNLTQAALIDSPYVHFGLGRHPKADVARIVWPNGSFQAEFDLNSKTVVVAEQRLKGSCPWVFAFDGTEYRFVKDFIWRSPLGLRINAQDTAGVTQTEDWIKVPGRQLAAVDGRYSLRITAELWETHFFDHVRLLAVDHPAEFDVFVDERFVGAQPQDQTVVVTTPPQPVVNAVDCFGRSLDAELQSADGVYADRFELGPYQGVAEEHWVQFELPADIDADRPVLLVGNGWVYPTDSSLNVAMAQGRQAAPHGLVLEQFHAESGDWKTLREGLGFPAGKNKDALILLPDRSLESSRRFRLRTNTETYWDSLGWAYRESDVQTRQTPAPLASATLQSRGYSKLVRPTERRRPDIPSYKVAATGQRWRDLEGFYTRLGDVRDLLGGVDDRYVIMNAGDELAFEFLAPEPPPAGWKRDFLLIGDGWVKDGDLNTAFSQWVRPLPAHGVSDYAGPLAPLSEDPAYQRHRDDWQTFHTRYVTPRRFQSGLWPTAPRTAPSDVEP